MFMTLEAYVSQVTFDTRTAASSRADRAFGRDRGEQSHAGLRARIAHGWRQLTAGEPAAPRVACPDCA